MNDITNKILKLKQEKNAVILSHYYQDEEIQEIADFIGDSFELSKIAKNAKEDIIVFCGVRFMAETALILNPEKIVLLPDLNAGCSLEESCQTRDFTIFREKYLDHIALSYINCSAEIKALSDIIVTSSNAVKIISKIPLDKKILFAPDKHLGRFLIKQTNRDMVLWHGSCIVHETFSERELIRLITEIPGAIVIAHPECSENLLNYAKYIGSTSALLNYVKNFSNTKFIVLTEIGIVHKMRINNPSNDFYFLDSENQAGCSICSKCPFMKLNNLEKPYLCIENLTPRINLDKNILIKARFALDNMID